MTSRAFRLGMAGLCMALLWPGCSKKPAASSADKEAGTSAGQKPELEAPKGPMAFKVKWPAGRRYTQRMDMKQISTMRIPDRMQPINQDLDMGMDYAIHVVKERPSTGPELAFEFLSTEMQARVNGKPVLSFDSGGESLSQGNNPMLGLIQAIMGTRLTMFLDSSNQVERIDGLDQFNAKASASVPPAQRAMVTNIFGQETFKQFAEFGNDLPAHPLRLGDAWPSRRDIPTGTLGKLHLDLQYRFTSWERHEGRDCALLEFSGTMSPVSPEPATMMGMEMKLEHGQMSGKSWFDPELGLPVERLIDQNMVMMVTVKMPKIGDQGGGTQILTNNIKQTVILKLTELTEAKP